MENVVPIEEENGAPAKFRRTSVQEGFVLSGMSNKRKGMEVGVSTEHVRAMSHHSGQRHALQMGTIFYDYTKADSMTPMVIIEFLGE